VGWPHCEPRYTRRCWTRNNSVPRSKRSPGRLQTRTWSVDGDLGHHPALDSQQRSTYVRFSVLHMIRCPAWDADLSRPTRHLFRSCLPVRSTGHARSTHYAGDSPVFTPSLTLPEGLVGRGRPMAGRVVHGC
jgi:hypothetical protein